MLSPVPLVFLLLFLLSGQISELAFPDEAKARSIGGVSRAPIVVVLLDELPSNTLVDANDELDTKRYPGLRGAREERHLVQERLHGVRLDRARAAGDHGRRPARKGQAADPV